MLIKTKKWMKAKAFVEAHPFIRKNLNLSLNAGKLYLNTHKIKKAEGYFENALELNPHTNLEKLIAEVYLQSGQAVKASSILTGYINRNFNDLEAHIQLLYSYFLSERWELGYEQSKLLLDVFPKDDIIKNNHAVFCFLLDKINDFPETKFDKSFGQYNYQVFSNNNPQSWYKLKSPNLSDKLLFQEYKFRHISKSPNSLEIITNGETFNISDSIISFGRKGFEYNTFSEFEGISVSRRHFVIINMKNNVWLYDLNSTGVYVDEKRVNQKTFLLGLHKIKFGNFEVELKTDDKILL
jgi:tetratricopeptide (TPR) repeat protein